MTDTINIHNRPRNTVATSDSPKNATDAGAQSTKSSGSQAGKSNPAAIIELSNPGLLENISDQIDKIPEVNEARVASVKQSLAQGEYQPDADVIARKFREIEKLLP